MTEEEFIKDYFRNKKIFNESDGINAAIDLTTGFLSQGDPLTRCLEFSFAFSYGLKIGRSKRRRTRIQTWALLAVDMGLS